LNGGTSILQRWCDGDHAGGDAGDRTGDLLGRELHARVPLDLIKRDIGDAIVPEHWAVAAIAGPER
jgi:hypothetical protein